MSSRHRGLYVYGAEVQEKIGGKGRQELKDEDLSEQETRPLSGGSMGSGVTEEEGTEEMEETREDSEQPVDAAKTPELATKIDSLELRHGAASICMTSVSINSTATHSFSPYDDPVAAKRFAEGLQLRGKADMSARFRDWLWEIQAVAEEESSEPEESAFKVSWMVYNDGGENDEEWKLNNGEEILVMTAYKRVGVKVHPVSIPYPPDKVTRLFSPTYSRDPYATPLVPRMPRFKYGGKLTEENVALVDLGGEGALNHEERNLILGVLRLREGALATEPIHRGLLKSTYAEPAHIATIPHEPWKQRPITIPAAIRERVVELVRQRVNTGLYEPSTSSYSSRWFVVQKKSGDLRIVHDLQELNGKTIRNSGQPPRVEEFIGGFPGCQSYALLDVFGGYDQFPIDDEYRDKMTFQTALGPMRLTRLPQGATNLVADFQRLMEHVMAGEIGDHVGFFINDVGMKGPRSDYGGATIEENPEIRRFVWEHVVKLECILFRLEEAGLTVSLKKLQAFIQEATIVGIRVSKEGSRMEERKMNKIERFPRPKDVTKTRSFLGLCTFVRQFIQDFGKIARPLRDLTKKDAKFVWTEECEAAFKELKKLVGRDVLLSRLDYGERAGQIILAVDSSQHAAGAVLWQEDANGKRRPVRYESLTFTAMESRYSQPKLELAGVAKMLKKLQHLLWGTHFMLEVDASAVPDMIRNLGVPYLVMTRWIDFIRLFDANIHHVPGKSHVMADTLSCVRTSESDSVAWLFTEMMSAQVLHALVPETDNRQEDTELQLSLVRGEYKGFWRRLGEYLETLERPVGVDAKEYKRIRLAARRHFVRDGRIYRRDPVGEREVVVLAERRENLMRALHDESGHRGNDEILRRLRLRFFWQGMEGDVREYVKTCRECQMANPVQERERRRATLPAGVFTKVHFDCVHLIQGELYIISARDDLKGWIEARVVPKITSKALARFVQEDVARFGHFYMAVVDGGSEFRGDFRRTLEFCKIRRVVTAAYHPEANTTAERGHAPIVSLLRKLCNTVQEAKAYLPHVLFADRISTSRATGRSPYELLYGSAPILPIDFEERTWLGIDWEKIDTREGLLEARVATLVRKKEMVQKAHERLRKSRQASIAYHDRVNAHRIREPLVSGQWVIVAAKREMDTGKKLGMRWEGPYRVVKRLRLGSYLLSEADGAVKGQAYAAKLLRRYYPRGRGIDEVDAEEIDGDMERARSSATSSTSSADSVDQAEARELAREQPDGLLEWSEVEDDGDEGEVARRHRRRELERRARRTQWRDRAPTPSSEGSAPFSASPAAGRVAIPRPTGERWQRGYGDGYKVVG